MQYGTISVKNNPTQGNENNNDKNCTLNGAEVRQMINKTVIQLQDAFQQIKSEEYTCGTISEGIKGQ